MCDDVTLKANSPYKPESRMAPSDAAKEALSALSSRFGRSVALLVLVALSLPTMWTGVIQRGFAFDAYAWVLVREDAALPFEDQVIPNFTGPG
jgi:hypothetical protein